MQLQSLLSIHGHLQLQGRSPTESVRGISFDSRQVEEGFVYVAVAGSNQDGHDYIPSAIEKGAIAVVVENRSKVPESFCGAILEVLDARLSLQVLSQKFYGSPGDSMISIAVTGTNGKTSSAYILEHMLRTLKLKCGVIGTIDHHLEDRVWDTDLTSPDPLTLQKRLKEFRDLGAESFVVEASSHALDQKRLQQKFDVALFTNLSRDHLDYHKSMDDYFEAKALLFSETMVKEGHTCYAVINGDDPYGRRLVDRVQGRHILRFGQEEDNDIRFSILEEKLEGCLVEVKFPNQEKYLFMSPLLGIHNVYNSVGCLSVLYSLGMDLKRVTQVFKDFSGVPGRMQLVKSPRGVYGYVDYAHTPDALEKALKTVGTLLSDEGRLILVFGCGGDRDKGKRPVMGKMGAVHADILIVTSDNPRTEDPSQIISDILSGLTEECRQDPGSQIFSMEDRKQAIQRACDLANPGDVILVAGKGHESYQLIGNETFDFDDVEVLQWFLRKAEQT